MPAEVETMFYAGEVPWHGLGVGVEVALTSAEAIRLAGLDWEVAVGPLYGPDYGLIPDKFSVYRNTDYRVLGVVSGSYVPLQNRDAFNFMDSLAQDGVIRYEAAASLLGGKRIFLLASLEQDIRVGQDEYKPYLLLSTGHDGNTSVRVLPTTVRVVCNNTLQMALRSGSGIWIEHSPGLHRRLDAASKVLRITTEASRRLVDWLQRLNDIPADDLANTVEIATFGVYDDASIARQKSIDLFQQIYGAEVERSGDTAYAVACAITGYGDHGRTQSGDVLTRPERHLLSIAGGSAARFKDDALEIVSQVTGVAY